MTEPTPEPARFGWCLCGDHQACRAQVSYHGKSIRCGCGCHDHRPARHQRGRRRAGMPPGTEGRRVEPDQDRKVGRMNALTGLVPEWHRRAACAGTNFLYWPVERQKGHCNGCQVKAECLEYGLAQPYRLLDSETYGGHTNRELAALRNARKGTGNGVV